MAFFIRQPCMGDLFKSVGGAHLHTSPAVSVVGMPLAAVHLWHVRFDTSCFQE
jgi:hypothetical protein